MWGERAAALRPVTRKLIRKMTTTDADSKNGAQMLAFFFVAEAERAQRQRSRSGSVSQP
jgi:hypothetical protein